MRARPLITTGLLTLGVLAGCGSPSVPTPVASPPATPASGAPPTPGPVVSSPTAASPAPSAVPTPAGPLTLTGLHFFPLLLGATLRLEAEASRPVRIALSEASGEVAAHTVRLEAGPRAGGAYRVAGTPVSWPFPVTPRVTGTPGTGRQVLQAAAPREVGSVESFWINDGTFQASGDRSRSSVLRVVTDHAYFYVDREAMVSDADMRALATEFEAKIHPRVTAAFGPEARPGVDGEDRLFIVVTSVFNADDNDLLGYFWARDAMPLGKDFEHSNHKEVLFVTDQLFRGARVLRYGAIAHELQHLINWSRKGARLGYATNEATWLDEGLSMMAMELAGYGVNAGDQLVTKDIAAYQRNIEAYSLTEWNSNPNGQSFGQSYLFMRYLVDRFGEGVLRSVIDREALGIAAVDEVLREHGTRFETVHQEWVLTNLQDGKGAAPYRYQSLDLTGTYGGISLPGFSMRPLQSATVTLRPWGSSFLESTSGNFSLQVGPETSRILGGAVVR